MAPIQAISLAIPAPPIAPAGITQGQPGEFHNLLQSAIGTVEQNANIAHQAVQGFLSGDSQDLHTVALATQRAELSSELFLQVRNKVVSAYQEIMRMQM